MYSARLTPRGPGAVGAGVRGAGPAPAGGRHGAARGAGRRGARRRLPAQGVARTTEPSPAWRPSPAGSTRRCAHRPDRVRAAGRGGRPDGAADQHRPAPVADGLPRLAAGRRGAASACRSTSARTPSRTRFVTEVADALRSTGVRRASAHARAHRGRRGRRPGAGRRADARAAGARAQAVGGRLRHRLLLAHLPQGPAHRRGEDRQGLRRRAGRRRRATRRWSGRSSTSPTHSGSRWSPRASSRRTSTRCCALGVDEEQGYLHAVAMPANEMTAWLTAPRPRGACPRSRCQERIVILTVSVRYRLGAGRKAQPQMMPRMLITPCSAISPGGTDPPWRPRATEVA